MSYARTRKQSLVHPGGGTYRRNSVVTTNQAEVIGTDICEDVNGNLQGDNRLVITKKRFGYFILNGDNQDLNAPRAYKNWRTLGFQAGVATLPTLNLSSLATRVGAGTNPGRPTVNLPVFFWELRELPGLIRLAGRSILQKIASGYLSWNFGWRPLISDLMKLISLQDTVEKRLQELRKLRQKGVLRRTLQLGTDSADTPWSNRTEDSGAASLHTAVRSHTSRKVWGSCVWKMTSPSSVPASRQEQVALARSAVLGLNLGNISLAIWEALPWSWMIDWFTDIGSWLKATNNSIAYAVNASACIMATTISTDEVKVTSIAPYIKDYVRHGGTYVEKRRTSVPFSPFSTSMPILSIGQLATAAALAIQRLPAYATMKRK